MLVRQRKQFLISGAALGRDPTARSPRVSTCPIRRKGTGSTNPSLNQFNDCYVLIGYKRNRNGDSAWKSKIA